MVKIRNEEGWATSFPYDPKIYEEYKDTHYVFARVTQLMDGWTNEFDARIIAVREDGIVVRTGSVEAPVRNYFIPDEHIQFMSVGIEREEKAVRDEYGFEINIDDEAVFVIGDQEGGYIWEGKVVSIDENLRMPQVKIICPNGDTVWVNPEIINIQDPE